MSTIDLRSRARWLQVPGGSVDEVVQEFAMAYDGYRLHGPSPDNLTAALRHVIDPDGDHWEPDVATTEELRAALFLLGRRAAHGWGPEDQITRQPQTARLLEALRARSAGAPLLSVASPGHGYGATPPDFRLDHALADSLSDVLLLSALHLAELDSDQLAWLAITSKAEHAVRDTWGWMLQSALPNLSVTREWKHADLAVLDGATPRVLIEGKAMYGFDALSAATRAKYVQLVANDLAKTQRLAPDAYQVATVLTTTVESPWDEERTASVAYAGGNARTAAQGAEATARATELMWKALSELGQVGVVDLGTGTAFEASVNTTLFLVRPRGSRVLFGKVSTESWAKLWTALDVVVATPSDALLEWRGGEKTTTTDDAGEERSVIQMPYVSYAPAVRDLTRAVSAVASSVPRPGGGATDVPQAPPADDDPVALLHWAFRIIRGDRFVEGLLAGRLQDGSLVDVLNRLRSWHERTSRSR